MADIDKVKIPEVSFFSLLIRPVDQDSTPIIIMADVTCDLCGHEFQIRSPSEAINVLGAVVHHLRTKHPASESPDVQNLEAKEA